mmetsp:Transcript_3174/g.7499  ORF Transcript_3174/g.7499 Transcript_3174/m.7499 type:complete len:211 (+) Transcript_3174:959-1591(+)
MLPITSCRPVMKAWRESGSRLPSSEAGIGSKLPSSGRKRRTEAGSSRMIVSTCVKVTSAILSVSRSACSSCKCCAKKKLSAMQLLAFTSTKSCTRHSEHMSSIHVAGFKSPISGKWWKHANPTTLPLSSTAQHDSALRSMRRPRVKGPQCFSRMCDSTSQSASISGRSRGVACRAITLIFPSESQNPPCQKSLVARARGLVPRARSFDQG